MKTIVLSGGHMSPAVAISEEMVKRKWNVVVFGRSHAFSAASSAMSLEKQIFEELGVKFYDVSISRLPSSVFQVPRYIVSFITTTYSILNKLKTINPSVVLSFGGYVSVPLLVASFLSEIPILLHDQTIKAGRANKFFSYIAKKVFISWKETKKDFPSFIQHKIVLAGNPVRKEIIAIDRGKPDFKNIHLYITGGSTGSHAINEVVSECMRELCEKYTVVHQVGDSHYHDFEKLEDLLRKLPVRHALKNTISSFF
jgi:UDP-N-acetylglucosamine--N-acetylmuramyl-(pentapeptide) pyrophosphoryl-undecaprenol N-acetylglucosamine transferase